MLVCPQCQFENPNSNKFCQECGTSLTHNLCSECDSLVPFDSLQCPSCGAVAGVVWQAIVVGKFNQAGAVDTYLDRHQRYRLLEPLQAQSAPTSEQQARVLDCQPLQLSPLETYAGTESELCYAAATTETEMVTTSDPTSQVMPVMPSIVRPYLELQHKLHQALPLVHNAWNETNYQVLLIEDRTSFPKLLDLWLNDELSLPPLQILHWLYEMADLWHTLEPWGCCQSLLEVDNLRVDEDQVLCLQRLYSDPQDTPATLQDLAHVWQTLFAQSQRTQVGAMARLLADLEMGFLTTITDIQARIEAIAQELQLAQSQPAQPSTNNPAVPVSPPSTVASPAKTSTSGLEDSSPAATRLEVPLHDLEALVDDDDDNDDLPTVVLPMQLFSLDDVGRTDIGRQRDHNEDYFGIETQVSRLESPSGRTVHVRNLYVLCDGMGGHAGGEVASALAVDTIRRYFKEQWQSKPFTNGESGQLPPPQVLIEAVQLANKAIYDVNQQNARSGSGRMGTTLVMLLVQDTEVAIAHVGDSRLYRYTRKRGLEQITVDHEVGQREIQRGVDPEIAYARPDAYQLTQALGPRDEHFIKPDVQYLELNEDTLLLLCSDGLTDNDLLENHYQSHVEPLLSSQTNLDQGVRQLIDLANQFNGHDNITAIAVRAKVRPNLQHLR